MSDLKNPMYSIDAAVSDLTRIADAHRSAIDHRVREALTALEDARAVVPEGVTELLINSEMALTASFTSVDDSGHSTSFWNPSHGRVVLAWGHNKSEIVLREPDNTSWDELQCGRLQPGEYRVLLFVVKKEK